MSTTSFKFPDTPGGIDKCLENIAGALRDGTFGTTECFGSDWLLLAEVVTRQPRQRRHELITCLTIKDLCRYILGMALMFRHSGATRFDCYWEVDRDGDPPVHLNFGSTDGAQSHLIIFKTRLQPGHQFTREELVQYATENQTTV